MDAVKRPSMLAAVLLTIVAGVLPIACLGQEANEPNYIELFDEGFKNCYMYVNPYIGLAIQKPSYSRGPEIRHFEPIPAGLNTSEAVPFLSYVLKNGPFWPIKEQFHQAHHLAKCYAATCLGMTKDSAAIEPLVEALRTIDKNETREYVSVYAAIALGLLGDPNVVETLIETFLYEERPLVCWTAAGSLGRLGSLRAIKPIIDYLINLEKPKLNNDSTEYTNKQKELRAKIAKNRYRQRVTGYGQIIAKIAKMKVEYKEVSDVQFWSDWWQNGAKLTEQRFNAIYSKWKNEKKNDRPKYMVKKQFFKMIDLGIPALPLMIEKVKQGETDFIPAISQLTDGKLQKGATKAECLEWWNKNKQKWLIPFGEKLRVGVEKL